MIHRRETNVASDSTQAPSLTDAEVDQFIRSGFVRIDGAFPRETAEAARTILWRDLGADADDPSTWTRPVVRLGMYADAPFVEAANSARLHGAFDQLAGSGRWQPCRSLGTFPVRFPSSDDPGDTGWHVDPGFDWHQPDFLSWRTNIVSKGRALLMLFLFSDVGDDDAPTRLRVGSHLDVARALAPAGDAGLTLGELMACDFGRTGDPDEATATGEAGTVYLCHPFLVHSAQPHRGRRPRFLAQPPLVPSAPLALDRSDGAYSPVERAVRLAFADRG